MRHRGRPGRRFAGGQFRALLATIVLVAGLLPTDLVAVARAAGPVLPSGFTDELLATGLNHPTALAFAPNGRVYVAEQRGIVKTWPSYAALVANQAPDTALDIQSQVDNYWDRGLLGLAVDPDWPAQPYIYVLYAFDALPGGSPPRWSDACPAAPSGPGSTTDGCVASGRLDRVPVNPATGVASGALDPPHHRLVPAIPEPLAGHAHVRRRQDALRERRRGRELQRRRLGPVRRHGPGHDESHHPGRPVPATR